MLRCRPSLLIALVVCAVAAVICHFYYRRLRGMAWPYRGQVPINLMGVFNNDGIASVENPIDIVGDFYIDGNVNFRGAISLSGRPMTLKMAIAAAGGLGPLAWPKRCEVVRRIGKDESGRWREEIVMVDLDKIARGEQPDFFIKPNDLIRVGTHPTARWRAVLRNAFRATYGFGFIYDRNFADRDFGTRRPIPDWF